MQFLPSDEAIKNNEIQNAKDACIPPTFEINNLDNQTFNIDGKLLIIGQFDKEATIPNKFTKGDRTRRTRN